MTEHADVGGQAAAGDFFAGQYLDQLLFATRGIFGREHLDQIAAFANRRAYGIDGFGLVVFDADHHLLGLDQVRKDFDAGNQLRGFLAHQ